MLGRSLGLLPVPIHVTNIVVGDLPLNGPSAVYIYIEVGRDPLQVTSVKEDCNPKVVQFRSSFTPRLRDSPFEKNGRFLVKELHSLGHIDRCDCYIRPSHMINWSEDESGPKRFKLNPLGDHGTTFNMPSWILMEVVSGENIEREEAFRVNFQSTIGPHVDSRDPAEFKNTYQLLDTSGQKSEEPKEEEVGKLDALKRRRTSLLRWCCAQIAGTIALLLGLSFYTYWCNIEFKNLEILSSYHALPMQGDLHRAQRRVKVLQACYKADVPSVSHWFPWLIQFGVESLHAHTSRRLGGGEDARSWFGEAASDPWAAEGGGSRCSRGGGSQASAAASPRPPEPPPETPPASAAPGPQPLPGVPPPPGAPASAATSPSWSAPAAPGEFVIGNCDPDYDCAPPEGTEKPSFFPDVFFGWFPCSRSTCWIKAHFFKPYERAIFIWLIVSVVILLCLRKVVVGLINAKMRSIYALTHMRGRATCLPQC